MAVLLRCFSLSPRPSPPYKFSSSYCTSASDAFESGSREQSAPPPSSVLIAQELNKSSPSITFVLQKYIQVRIETQGKYLHSMLERASSILIDLNLGAIEHDSVRHELSELQTWESDGCVNFQYESLKMPSLSELTVACTPQITVCSMDSSLAPTESPGKVSVLKKRRCPLLGTDQSHACYGDV